MTNVIFYGVVSPAAGNAFVIGAKLTFFCRRHRMLVVQMAVRFYRQSAADFVAEPAADRGDIDAGFIAGGRKEIAEIAVPASGEKSNGCWPKRRKRHTLCRLLCMIVTPLAVAF